MRTTLVWCVTAVALGLAGQAQGEDREPQTLEQVRKTLMGRLSEADVESTLSKINIEYARVSRDQMREMPNLSRNPEELRQSYIGVIRNNQGDSEEFLVVFDIDLSGKVVDIRIDRIPENRQTDSLGDS